jgi:hypothetical protein
VSDFFFSIFILLLVSQNSLSIFLLQHSTDGCKGCRIVLHAILHPHGALPLFPSSSVVFSRLSDPGLPRLSQAEMLLLVATTHLLALLSVFFSLPPEIT